jgi:hypothetical protein
MYHFLFETFKKLPSQEYNMGFFNKKEKDDTKSEQESKKSKDSEEDEGCPFC